MKTFWVTNITNLNVSLSDLNLTIPARRTMNLLDSRHFHYTLEQLQKSSEQGSLYKKSDKIKIRKVAPKLEPPSSVIQLSDDRRQGTLYSSVKIIEKKYEELEITDEQSADEMSNLKII